jgi:hypothetical protein
MKMCEDAVEEARRELQGGDFAILSVTCHRFFLDLFLLSLVKLRRVVTVTLACFLHVIGLTFTILGMDTEEAVKKQLQTMALARFKLLGEYVLSVSVSLMFSLSVFLCLYLLLSLRPLYGRI